MLRVRGSRERHAILEDSERLLKTAHAHGPLTLATTWFALVWDLDGDGVPDTTDVVPLRTFAHPGTFSAVVTVTDSVRCTGRASVFITVER